MWRVPSIASLCRQCLVSQRNRNISTFFYSTSATRKPSSPTSGKYEISGIYSGVQPPKDPKNSFLNSLNKAASEKEGGKRDQRKGRPRGGARSKGREEEKDGAGDTKGKSDQPRRDWRKYRSKGKSVKEQGSTEGAPMKVKVKKKIKPFVIYKAPPRVAKEEDNGDYENTMFVKKLKPITEEPAQADAGGEMTAESTKDEKKRATTKKAKKEPAKTTKTLETKSKKGTKITESELTPQVSGKTTKHKNSMFQPAEEEEGDLEEGDLVSVQDEEVDEELITEETKQKIRNIGTGVVQMKKGELFTNYTVQQAEDDMRVDRWAGIHFPTLPHAQLCKFLRNKLISYSAPPDIQRKKATTDTRLKAGNIVYVYNKLGLETVVKKAPVLRLNDKELEVVRSWVIHKDEHILVINKPEGLACQGGTKVGRHLAQMLYALRGEKEEDPRLVHRLDRETSGVLVLARTRKAATKLGEMFKGNNVTKVYWALVAGVPKTPIGRINMPLEKITGARGEEQIVPREKVTKTAKAATTDFNVVEELSTCSFVVLSPNTGRTHQLRVHCAAALGAHIVGDQKYGDGREVASLEDLLEGAPEKLHLHARRIVFKHPFSGQKINVAATLPPHMLHTWGALGLNPNYKEKLSQVAENFEKEQAVAPKKSEYQYGKTKTARRSIWNPKPSATPIRDMKLRAVEKKRGKLRKLKKRKEFADKKKEEEKKKTGGDRHKSSASLLKDKRYRAMRRVRPVRRLAPKIKR